MSEQTGNSYKPVLRTSKIWSPEVIEDIQLKAQLGNIQTAPSGQARTAPPEDARGTIKRVEGDYVTLSIGSDAGVFYCRNTSDGSTPTGWTDFVVPTGTDRSSASSARVDP